MSAVLPTRKDKGKTSTGWIWRMTLGMGLIGLSLWGIVLCPGVFRTYVGPDPSPVDTSFVKLAAGAAWFVFFGPVAVAGLVMLWLAQRRLGVLDQLAAWREARAAQVYGPYAGGKPHGWRVVRSEESSHEGLGSLSDEKAARLTKKARRAAILLGLSAGTFFVVSGVCGLIFVSSSHIYSTVSFAILSGISILVGLKVLHRTIRRENNAWLLTLRLFTDAVLRRHHLSADDDKSRLSERVR
jgi:hypothetical protein